MNKLTPWTLLLFLCACQPAHPPIDYTDWSHYGGPEDGSRYSSLAQIHRGNVNQLEVAWVYSSGDATERSQIQCQPIVKNGLLYATSPGMKVFALDASTGKERWKFDPFEVLGGENSWAGTNRGLSYWEKGEDKRILFGAGNWLMAVDASTGKPIRDFGEHGKIDLRENLDTERSEFMIVANTPGVVYEDLLILGMRLSEGLDAAPGHIRAYHIPSGTLAWTFHTIPKEGDFGYDSWDPQYIQQIGGANNWAGMVIDQHRGIVYAPTGSATYDFWGGYRHGANLFANSLLALDAKTGRRLWHFQGIHHDVWDRDFPSPPTLARIQQGEKWVDAVVQPSKQGYAYVFDRETGQPLWPIEEMPVPQTRIPGEKTSPTQPIPSLPEPFMDLVFEEKDILNLNPEWQQDIQEQLKNARFGHSWIPPDHQQPIVLFPGMDGGAEWGGSAFDPDTQVLYINANQIPWLMEMTPNSTFETSGQRIYASYCGNCHGLEKQGNLPTIPALQNLRGTFTADSLDQLLKKGRGAMPAFDYLSETQRKLLVDFLLDMNPIGDKYELESGESLLSPRYTLNGYKKLLTKEGLYGSNPPWGVLTALDLKTGRKKWQIPLGEIDSLKRQGFGITGTENYGGPVVTAGGILFIAATKDEKIRAFDKETGELLWEAKLPAAGHATPALYQAGGRQFLVIACGGGKGTPSGDSYVAFALPDSQNSAHH